MHRPSASRLALVAALSTLAAQFASRGQRLEIRESPEVNLADTLVERWTRNKFAQSLGFGSTNRRPSHAFNGGGRRKAEIARRHARKYGHCRMGRYHA